MNPGGDAGMSVVEVLVVLAIVAGATAMAAAALPRVAPPMPDSAHRLAAFVREARFEAMRTGEALLLEIDAEGARAGFRTLRWGAVPGLTAGGRPVERYRAILSPDGIMAGDELSLRSGAATIAIPASYRSPSR